MNSPPFILFICFPAIGYLGEFHDFAVVKRAAVNLFLRISCIQGLKCILDMDTQVGWWLVRAGKCSI